MSLNSGTILRRIVTTPLSTSAHKLATIILDATSWKDGFNGLERGTASFFLADLEGLMGVSRQYLSLLLAEIDASDLGLERKKLGNKFSPWTFRWLPVDKSNRGGNGPSRQDDRSLLRESLNKTIFTGRIEIGDNSATRRSSWLKLIEAAKGVLPCCGVDAATIWERFQAFNRAKGNLTVPAGYLLGFMRKWRVGFGGKVQTSERPVHHPDAAREVTPAEQHAAKVAAAAPSGNWQFHRADLERLIGRERYEDRIASVMGRLGLGRFRAMLVVHGEAASRGELLT